MTVSVEGKTLARAAWDAFGGARPTVSRYWDEQRVRFVDVLLSSNSPQHGVTAVATLGLCGHSNGLEVDGKPLRVELVGASGSTFQVFANIVATCGFDIFGQQLSCRPGVIIRNAINMYLPSSPMKHVMLVAPFLWGDKPDTVHFDDKIVSWLQVVPVSENERLYAAKNGSDALESLFERVQVDVFDLNRASAV